MKNRFTALLLSIFVGGLGVDRFYLGYIGMGVLKLLTAGGFGILYIYDIIMIAIGKLRPADGSPYDDENQNQYGTGYDNTGYGSYDSTGNANRSSWEGSSRNTNGTNTEKRHREIYDDLERISRLHDQGALNDAEFNKLKEDLLSKL